MKRLSLANLAREFEKLAEQFHSSAIQVARRKSLQAPRHEIDSIYAVQAGTLLLLALDQGFLKGEKPAPWDLRQHKRDDLLKYRFEFAKQRAVFIAPPEQEVRPLPFRPYCAPATSDRLSDESLTKKYRAWLESASKLQDKFRRHVESFLDFQGKFWSITATCSWQAFIRLELIPKNVSLFRHDYLERLSAALLADFPSEVTAPLRAEENEKAQIHWESDDERIRFCVRARADIYSTACKIVAEMLWVERKRRASELGQSRARNTTVGDDPSAESDSTPQTQPSPHGNARKLWLKTGQPPEGWHKTPLRGMLKDILNWAATTDKTLRSKNGRRWWVTEWNGKDEKTNLPTPFAIYFPTPQQYGDAVRRRDMTKTQKSAGENRKKPEKIGAVVGKSRRK